MKKKRICAAIALACGVAVAATGAYTCRKLKSYEPVMTLISGGYEYDFVYRWVCDA